LLKVSSKVTLSSCDHGCGALQDEGLDAAEKQWKKERAGGNYGAGTKEVQQRNYVARKEAERKRREMFDDALAKFKSNDIQVGRWWGQGGCGAGNRNLTC
jgi:hypothetical protein